MSATSKPGAQARVAQIANFPRSTRCSCKVSIYNSVHYSQPHPGQGDAGFVRFSMIKCCLWIINQQDHALKDLEIRFSTAGGESMCDRDLSSPALPSGYCNVEELENQFSQRDFEYRFYELRTSIQHRWQLYANLLQQQSDGSEPYLKFCKMSVHARLS